MSSEGIAAQLTRIKAREDRGDRLWMALAINSFPVPVSPRINTVGISGRNFIYSLQYRRKKDHNDAFLNGGADESRVAQEVRHRNIAKLQLTVL